MIAKTPRTPGFECKVRSAWGEWNRCRRQKRQYREQAIERKRCPSALDEINCTGDLDKLCSGISIILDATGTDVQV